MITCRSPAFWIWPDHLLKCHDVLLCRDRQPQFKLLELSSSAAGYFCSFSFWSNLLCYFLCEWPSKTWRMRKVCTLWSPSVHNLMFSAVTISSHYNDTVGQHITQTAALVLSIHKSKFLCLYMLQRCCHIFCYLDRMCVLSQSKNLQKHKQTPGFMVDFNWAEPVKWNAGHSVRRQMCGRPQGIRHLLKSTTPVKQLNPENPRLAAKRSRLPQLSPEELQNMLRENIFFMTIT